MQKRLGYVLGIMGFGLIIAGVSRHFNHWKERDYQEHLLKGAAGYLRKYSDENPGEALRNVAGILGIVRESRINSEGLSDVLVECERARNRIGGAELPFLYRAELQHIAERIEALV